MYGHFSSLYPVDMIFKTNSKGELTPCRFKLGGVYDIYDYKRIVPKGEMKTKDGVYLTNDMAYYEASYIDPRGIQKHIRLYYMKKETIWVVSTAA